MRKREREERYKRIIAYIKRNEPCTSGQLSEALGLRPMVIYHVVTRLKKKGLIIGDRGSLRCPK